MKANFPNDSIRSFLTQEMKVVIGDANIFLPIGRNDITKPSYIPFENQVKWILEPFLNEMNLVYVHETVLRELDNSPNVQKYVEEHPKIIILKDEKLSQFQQMEARTIEDAVATYTDYNPSAGCYKDEGEVKSISYAATLGIDYFISLDQNALCLLTNKDLKKFTRSVNGMSLCDIIYFLYKRGYDSTPLRKLYRFMYHNTKRDHSQNNNWEDFINSI